MNRLWRSTRRTLAASALMLTLIVASAGSLTVSIVGNPAAPATVVRNNPYELSVTVVASASCTVHSCGVESKPGTSTGPDPNANWVRHGTYQFSGQGSSGIHTFNVVNEWFGYYWWRGYGNERTPTNTISPDLFTGDYGYYFTATSGGGGP